MPVSFTAPEDADKLDDVAVARHFVLRVPYDHYKPCEGETDEAQCRQDWDDAWANSPYAELAGAGVKVTVKDKD